MGAFTNILDVTQPPDTQAANLLGLDIRNLTLNIQQRMAAISGLDSGKPQFQLDAQPDNWNNILYFAIDTGRVYQFTNPNWNDISDSFFSLTKPRVVVSIVTIVDSAIPLSILYAIPPGLGGMFRVTFDAITTASEAGVFETPTVSWNNGLASPSQVLGSLNLNTVGNEASSTFSLFGIAGSSIMYQTTYTGTGVGRYQLIAKLEYLG